MHPDTHKYNAAQTPAESEDPVKCLPNANSSPKSELQVAAG
jgi:hypothetical protein